MAVKITDLTANDFSEYTGWNIIIEATSRRVHWSIDSLFDWLIHFHLYIHWFNRLLTSSTFQKDFLAKRQQSIINKEKCEDIRT